MKNTDKKCAMCGGPCDFDSGYRFCSQECSDKFELFYHNNSSELGLRSTPRTMKYASQQLFGGRRAKIGDIVLIRIQEGMFGPMIRPCIVVGINPDDGIIARDLGEGSNRNTNGFIETHTIEDVETLQVIHWTWPLK